MDFADIVVYNGVIQGVYNAVIIVNASSRLLEMSETKEKILKATSEIFLEGGLPALSVRAVSKRAGLSTIGIYSHFQGKQGILDALYIEGFEMVHKVVTIDDEDLTPKEAVIQAAKNYFDFANKYQAHYRLMYGESESGFVPSSEAKTVGAKAFAQMAKLVSRLLPKDVPLQMRQVAALEIWALAHGYISLQHHAVNEMVDVKAWRYLTVDAIARHIDAMLVRQPK